jgi:hypothetical protein
VRRTHPAPTTAPLDDDFDALTLPATSLRASLWMPDEYANGFECTFGGAVERVVRSSGMWMEETRSDETLTPLSMEGQTLSLLRSRRTSRDVEKMDDEQKWLSMGRRGRDGKKGTRRLVPKRVLEDTPERTVTLWREEVVPIDGAHSDESTLAGSADEFGRYKPGGPSKWKRSAGSTSSMAKSKLGYVPTGGETFQPATAESMLGLAEVSYGSGSRTIKGSPMATIHF